MADHWTPTRKGNGSESDPRHPLQLAFRGHGPCVTDSDPIKAARQLLEEAEALASRQSPISGADRILMHPRLVECVRNLLMHHEGRSHETKRLVMLVVALVLLAVGLMLVPAVACVAVAR